MTDASLLNSKRVVYVGGLAEEVTIPLLRACMIPFGPIHSIDMVSEKRTGVVSHCVVVQNGFLTDFLVSIYHVQPMDYAKGTSKGIAFVEFEEADDATEAIFNRNGASLLGRTIHVSMAQANQVNKLTEPVWNSDEWYQQQQQSEDAAAAAAKEGEEALRGK